MQLSVVKKEKKNIYSFTPDFETVYFFIGQKRFPYME